MKIGLMLCLLLQVAACRSGSDTAHEPGGQQTADPKQATFPADGDGVPATFRLEPGRAGKVEIGMSEEALQAAFPAPLLVQKQINREGQTYTVYEILNDSFSHETGLVAEPDCRPECRIFRIQIRDRKYETAGGISIGSRYGDLRRIHPISAVTTETGEIAAIAEEIRMSFILDPNTLSANPGQQLQPESVPDSAIVSGILLF